MQHNDEPLRLAKARLCVNDEEWQSIPADRRERLLQYYRDELAMAQETLQLAGKVVAA